MSNLKANVSPRRTASARDGWIARLKAQPGEGPKYLSIAQGLAAAVEAGELAPGDRLPPQRRVAEALGCDLTTVTRAYAQAREMGLLDGEVGRGTFVRGAASPTGPIIDLSMNLPPPAGDESLRDLIGRGLAATLKNNDPAALMNYRSGMGSLRDKRAAAAWLQPLLGDVDPACICVAPGAQAALAALLPMLSRAGDTVLAEPFTYPGFLAIARLLGVSVAALQFDDEGPLPDALEVQCKSTRPKAIYLNPTLQNPTTRTIAAARRDAIIAIARKHDLTIVEDDAYGRFAPNVTPLARLAPERVIYVSTLAKCLSPGLRTAFVVAPPALCVRVSEALRAAFLMPVPLLSDMAVHWIESGVAQRLFNAIAAESAARMKLARKILPARARGGAGGFHLWMSLPPGSSAQAYAAAARAQGVVVVASQDFAAEADTEPSVRISLGAPPDRETLARGLNALADLEKDA
ncbi:PLP-dependent aminotransferase family protein [Vitreimonas flagellata]|uniref:aminotransferase-like domain-containing protein n=1 Tax=Vitreimonas flagellata TaxID=2560861 RepID=UPI001074D792|nr:PLP-dependent aminotransferase family protein [Vitreimonas flagellata]